MGRRETASARPALSHALISGVPPDEFLSKLYFPVGDGLLISGDPANRQWLRSQYGPDVYIVSCPPRVVLAAIERRYRKFFLQRAVSALAVEEPQFSASTVITRGQAIAFSVVAALLIVTLFVAPASLGRGLSALFAAIFVANAIFRVILFRIGFGAPPKLGVPEAPISKRALPIYSILVPLYREANVMPALIQSLRALDYPKDRLDIKLIVEADDRETVIVANAAAAIEPNFSVIQVPQGNPRTKPRACNYAMPFVRGEFTVIFDAEDRPEPDQLRKAVSVFRASPDSVACLQARLNFYNANENWLTRMFALDYALWFDYLLPGLDKLNIPMPLGGTSNHFRTEALRAIHCWDPYNVTEDADLGIRLARVGLRVRTLDSTTFEEATNCLDNWLKQRSRWLKGYMQTWLVHMRSPHTLLRNAGIGGFFGFQLFIGGTFLSALMNPVLWAILVGGKLFNILVAGVPLFDWPVHVSLFGLLLGNVLFAGLAILAPMRRGWLQLSPYGLTAPFYWALISCAGARALWQLITRPWHWDKTMHGLSKIGRVP